MRGGIKYQVTELFKESGVFTPGRSKHLAKQEARASGARTWREIGGRLSIHSHQTAKTYLDTWHRIARYCKEEMGLKDIEQLSGDHVLEYCLSRVLDDISYDSFQVEAAAVSKLAMALNMYAEKFETGRSYDFQESLDEAGVEAKKELRRNKRSRAYKDPMAVIDNIDGTENRVAALVQYQGDARLSEATYIKERQLGGIAKDPITSGEKGVIHLDFTKGGKPRDIMVSVETYTILEHIMKTTGKPFSVPKHSYIRAIKKACERAGQEYTGPHGLRWSYVHERLPEVMKHGFSYEQALLVTAKEMGHERPDITEHYNS